MHCLEYNIAAVTEVRYSAKYLPRMVCPFQDNSTKKMAATEKRVFNCGRSIY